jgi:threonine/homoserine/homoserine lactone efflux protein
MTTENLLTLSATMFVLSVIPGSSDFAIMAKSITSGFTQSLMMIFGIVIADILLMTFALYTLTELSEPLENLLRFAKYGCGGYLIYEGVMSLKCPLNPNQRVTVFRRSSYFSVFTGILMTLGDPTAILFYFVFFPNFVDLSSISTHHILIILLIATVIISSVKTSYAYFANQIKHYFDNGQSAKIVQKIAGCSLICIGLYILLIN